MIGWPVFLIIFANMKVFPAALALMVFVGIARGIAMVVIQLLLLMWSEEKMRVLVMGARMLAIFPLLLGNILTGIGAERWGAATIIVVNALCGIVTTVIAAIWAPHLRRRN